MGAFRKKREISLRNQALLAQLNTGDEELNVFTGERIGTYASVIFLPPYGLYRIWRKGSAFRRSERYAWTMMITAYLLYFLKLIIAG